MRLLRGILALVTIMSLLTGSSVDAEIGTTPAPPRLENSPLVISAYYLSAGTPHYLELYNGGSTALDARTWNIRIMWTNSVTGIPLTSPLVFNLSSAQAYIPAKSHIVIGFGNIVASPSVQVDAVTGESGEVISELRVENEKYQPYAKQFTATQTAPMRLNQTNTGYTSTGTYSAETRTTLYDDGFYVPLDSFPLAPIEILANPASCSPLSADLACKEYVKFYNGTSYQVSFNGTRLHAGSSTVILGGMVEPGQYITFSDQALSIPNGGGYVWLEDVYGVKIYDNTVVAYEDASSTTRKGHSWASIDGSWQWALPSPLSINKPLPAIPNKETSSNGLKPCRSDQYRNPLTNRCKLISSATTTLKPCAANQYRNPDTNRCRSIGSASSSSLTPCRAGQYRNPATNRCKSFTTADSLKPCAANQERNPETNRCRKIASSALPTADFPVSAIPTNKNGVSVGWLAFASVGLLVAGYGVWEWRHEIRDLLGRMTGLFRRG